MMRAVQILLHCYAKRSGTQWSAFCLDFSLAAQGDTFEEAKEKLESMIKSYLYDAIAGDDKEYSEIFLKRSAPLSEWLKYYFIKFVYLTFKSISHARNGIYKLFHENMPLVPIK